ncbi:MAG TPA: hypothetical protein VLT33_14435 [Labilithrix sp.]|nr:hypothetical protein [Labilithrix sp.]
MNALDHDTFHDLEIEALYEELDGPRAAAIHAHAASCEACASRFERLRRARMRGLAALAEPVSSDFESRVMAAVDAALARRQGGPVLVPRMQSGAAPPAAAPGAGAAAKVIPFFSRPSFAVAATLILVLGAAAILGQLSMAKKASAPMASAADEAPAASTLTPVPMSEPVAAATATAAAAAPAAAPLLATTEGDNAEIGGGANALAERSKGAAARRPAPPAMVAANEPAPPPPAAMAPSPAKSKPVGGAAAGPTDPSFAAAKALYGAGRYAEALPRFEALRGSNPEADLYAARCVQRINGCAAAVPRFDATAQRNAGTDVGNRARVEGDACTQRLQASKTAAPNAGPAATTSPGTPGGGAAGRPSTPKAPAELDNTLK